VLPGWSGGYGQLVVINNGGRLGHGLRAPARLGIGSGQRVSQGQTIGYVGSTGVSTGNHLHFEVRVDGSARNPRGYLGLSPSRGPKKTSRNLPIRSSSPSPNKASSTRSPSRYVPFMDPESDST